MKREPIRLFPGNAKPHEAFWKIRDANETGGEPEIEFYGYISQYSWYDDDITPAIFKNQLLSVGKEGPITIRIHSGGGDVFAASIIRSIIMDYPGKVTARIDGLCASAATFVATAADMVKIQDTGEFMIHDPSGFAMGTARDIKDFVKVLDTVKESIIEGYQSKTTLTHDQLSKMMENETWMTAKEALENGFVDEIITSNPAKEAFKNMAIVNAISPELMKLYWNVPEIVKNAVDHPDPVVTPTSEPVYRQAAAEKFRAEIKILI